MASEWIADQRFDAQAFLVAAGRYARSKGCRDEDIASEMLLAALEVCEKKPGQRLSLELIWLNAYERLHPRGSDGAGGRARRDALEHQVSDVKTTPEGDEIRITECTVVDFGTKYKPINGRQLGAVARRAQSDLSRAKYLARMPFGHLPFIL